MKYTKTLLASAVVSALGFGASNASANVYAHSFLEISAFQVGVFQIIDNEQVGANNTVTGFDLSSTNTAGLNGSGVVTFDDCSGTPGSNNCGGGPRLDASIASVGNAAPAENTFAAQGPAGFEYAWADSVVPTSQLSLDPVGSIEAGAEAELQSGTSAVSSAQLTSTTGFTFDFVINGTGGLSIDFEAALDNYVQILNTASLPAGSLADSQVQFTLESGTGTDLLDVSWSPSGVCDAQGLGTNSGVACSATAAFDLNNQLSINSVGSSSFNEAGAFSALITGLSDGSYSFALTTLNRTSLFQAEPVPVPGTLLLLGLGLAGLARRVGNKA